MLVVWVFCCLFIDYLFSGLRLVVACWVVCGGLLVDSVDYVYLFSLLFTLFLFVDVLFVLIMCLVKLTYSWCGFVFVFYLLWIVSGWLVSLIVLFFLLFFIDLMFCLQCLFVCFDMFAFVDLVVLVVLMGIVCVVFGFGVWRVVSCCYVLVCVFSLFPCVLDLSCLMVPVLFILLLLFVLILMKVWFVFDLVGLCLLFDLFFGWFACGCV